MSKDRQSNLSSYLTKNGQTCENIDIQDVDLIKKASFSPDAAHYEESETKKSPRVLTDVTNNYEYLNCLTDTSMTAKKLQV